MSSGLVLRRLDQAETRGASTSQALKEAWEEEALQEAQRHRMSFEPDSSELGTKEVQGVRALLCVI